MNRKVSRRDFIKTTTRAGVVMGIAGTGFLKRSSSGNFDVIIKNGLVLDGIQNKGYQADLGIRGELVQTIGNLKGASSKVIIDAADRVVCPGFIDIHTHTDFELLVNPKAESKIRQGVTTELTGNCGGSAFPLKSPVPEYEKKMAERFGINIDWTDLEGYHRALRRKGTAVNHGTLVGQGTIRSFVIGEENREPTTKELEHMKKLVAEAMEQGAFGISTGLEYTPSGFAETEELIELCKVAAQYSGFYATHIRSEDKNVIKAVAEAIRIAETAGLPLEIAHFKAVGRMNWWKMTMMIDLVERAAERGLPVTADRYPYTAFSTGISIIFPQWALDGGTEKLLERLKDKKIRQSMKAETMKKVEGYGWERILISNVHKQKNKNLIGKTVHEIAVERNRDPYEFVCDLLVDEGQDVSHIGFGMSEENTERVLKHPLVMLGSDGSSLAPYGPLSEGRPHPRNYGAFPQFLGHYVREKKILSLPEAIKKVTSMPAAKMGLQKRGTLEKGNFADVVVFDPETIMDQATFTDPHKHPVGIDYVLVNGQTVVDHEKHTGKLPGKVLHGSGKK